MEKVFWKTIKIIIFILFLILSLITIWMLILKITGHSPDITTIIAWVVGIILTFQILIITILFQVKGDLGEIKEFKRNQLNFNKQTIETVKAIKNK